MPEAHVAFRPAGCLEPLCHACAQLQAEQIAEAYFREQLDPRALEQPMIRALGQYGVTRASFGVQSFDRAVQITINRVQTFEETAAAAEAG